MRFEFDFNLLIKLNGTYIYYWEQNKNLIDLDLIKMNL